MPSPAPLGYRNQAKYVVGRGPGGGIVLGAYAPRSHDLVDLAGCQLIEPALAEVARALPALLEAAAVVPYDERKRTGQLRYVVLRANARAEVLVALITVRAEFPPGAALAARLLAEVPGVVGVVQNVNASAGNVIFGGQEQLLGGRARLEESIAGVAVELAAPAFLQLNRGVAAAVYQAIAARVAALPSAGDGRRVCGRLVDVYSGVGAIAFSLQALAEEIVAIEENDAATAAGSAAAERAGLAHLRFLTADAAAGLAALEHADVVVLNPPRAGASAAVVAAIVRLRPRLILYLSCNPTTLARDLALFTAPGSGFAVTQAQPFDMLPHTTHVETFAVLSRDR